MKSITERISEGKIKVLLFHIPKTLSNNTQVKKGLSREIGKYFEANESTTS